MNLVFNLVSAAIVYSIIAILLFLNRDKLEIESRVLFLFKSKKGLNLIRKIGSKFRKLWRIFGTVAIFASFYFMILIVNVLVKGLLDIVSKPQVSPKIVPIIPGVPIPGAPFFLPLWYGIISLGICVIIHEFAHGIMMKVEDIDLKSSGVGLLLALPVAFVEPIEEQMKNAKPISRMRVASAGPFANILFALILGLILSLTFYPFLADQIKHTGVRITKVQKGLPAEKAGLKKDEVIVQVNGKEVKKSKELLNVLQSKDPDSTVSIRTAEGKQYEVGLVEKENQVKIGVYVENNYEYKQASVERFSRSGLSSMFWFRGLFSWIQRLNFLIGVVNFLPIWAIDGSKILDGLLEYIIPGEKVKNIVLSFILYSVMGLFLINFLVPYIK